MVLLRVCIALTGDFNDRASAVGLVANVIMILALAWAVVAVTITIYKRLVPSPFYEWFVWHHKVDAAGQARYLQLLLTQESGFSWFIDSDQPVYLDDLLDVARN